MLVIEFDKRFLKDLANIPYKARVEIESFVFQKLQLYATISEVGNIEKMHGYKNAYKCRFGDYRIGLMINGNKIFIKRVLHRKEIYRFFP